MSNPELDRLAEARCQTRHWRRWGPYLSDRQWGTVREDYSADNNPWEHVTHDMARSYAYRWGEDGIAGISDNHQRLCFALTLWNGKDPILKERLFGLGNPEGNHGEAVKECYWHLEGTPTHSYLRFLYRYPQAPFPYDTLVKENARRSRHEPAFSLIDTGVFDENRFFDVHIEYAKAGAEDLRAKITIRNCGPDTTRLHVLPTLWFRNDWRWEGLSKPEIREAGPNRLRAEHRELGLRYLKYEGEPKILFTENESNWRELRGEPNEVPHVKDAFHRLLVHGEHDAVSPGSGSKCALWYELELAAGEERVLSFRLCDSPGDGEGSEEVFERRKAEAETFYESILSTQASPQVQNIQRKALAGLMWSKQWYHYIVDQWIDGDPGVPKPPRERLHGLDNKDWRHLYSEDILCMPDTWEYPWFAVWDSAFHAVTMALVDPQFRQAPTYAADAGVVYASQRPDASL